MKKSLKAGYANVMTIPPNVKYQDRFLKAYLKAKEREGYGKMENIEELLNQDDVLSRVHQFELERDEEKIFINVREPLGGSDKGTFIAVPTLIIQDCSNTEYVGLGDSVEEALKDCLKRIKGVPLLQIIPEK